MYSFKSQPKEKKKKEEQRIRLNQVHTGPYMLVIIRLSNALPLNLSHGHSFQEVEGSAVYCSTELLCDCALDRMYRSRGWKFLYFHL